MHTKEDIDNLAANFGKSQKILLALGDENSFIQTGSIPSFTNTEGCGNIENETGSNKKLLLF